MKTDEYRANARICEAQAAASREPFLKTQLLELARQWREMADQAELRRRFRVIIGGVATWFLRLWRMLRLWSRKM